MQSTVLTRLTSQVDISPFYFPVTADTFNFVGCDTLNIHADGCLTAFPQAVVIFGAITIFALLSWYFIPEDNWLRREQVLKAMGTLDGNEEQQEQNE